MPASTLRRPVVATGLLFAGNGAVFGAIVPRLPDLKGALGMGDAGFGLAMACFPAGALLGGLLAPLLLRARSDGGLAVATMLLACVLGGAVGLAPAPLLFAVVLLVFGVCDAVTDVAMNAHAIRVQARAGTSLINRFHAVWSLGAVLGGAAGSAAAGAGIAVAPQTAVTGVLCALVSLAAWPMRLAGTGHDDPHRDAPAAGLRAVPTAVWLRVLGLGLLCCCATVVEDFAQTWSALYLREVWVAGAGVAGLGFVGVQGMQLIGRWTGDGLTERLGAVRVARTGGVCVAVGAAAVLLGSLAAGGHGGWTVAAVLVGLGCTGWGVATVIPGAMVASDHAPGLPPGVGLSVLNWVLRLGFLASPPTLGAVAEYTGLRWTVAPMVAAGALVVVLARLLGPARRTTDRPAAAMEGTTP